LVFVKGHPELEPAERQKPLKPATVNSESVFLR